MSPEQLVALVVALSGLLGAIGIVIGQVAALRRDINGRLTQLLEATAAHAAKEGELAGRDFAAEDRRRSTLPPPPEGKE